MSSKELLAEYLQSHIATGNDISALNRFVEWLDNGTSGEEPYNDMVYRKVTEMADVLSGFDDIEKARIIERAMDIFHGRSTPLPLDIHEEITIGVTAYDESGATGYGDNRSRYDFESTEDAIAYAKSLPVNFGARAWKQTTYDIPTKVETLWNAESASSNS